jgi:hypothetical protein
MKKKLRVTKLALILCLITVAFSNCTKNNIRSASGVTYLTDFYGVNKEYTNVIANPLDSLTSIKVVIKWDENGIASYTTAIIPKIAGNDAPGARVLLPPTEYNKDSAFIKPTNQAVKTKCLVFENGAFSEQTFSSQIIFICCTNYGFGPHCTSAPFWEVNPSNGWSGWSCGPHCYAVPCILTATKRPIMYYQAIE